MENRIKECLLNPGPVTLTDRVRKSLLQADLCHREREYADLQADVRSRLVKVYDGIDQDYSAVLFTGSGTSAVEAMVGSLIPQHGKALVAVNGVYGERIASMLTAHGKDFDTVCSEWTEEIDFEKVSESLSADKKITHVVAVHHETTTGRLNDLDRLAKICGEHDVAMLLDTVSSFGGEWIDFKNWPVEACAATANKCLHGVPGISFVLVRKAVFETRESAACSIYLDLFANYHAQSKGAPLFTPSVQSMYALQEALEELSDNGGWQMRHGQYRQLAQIIRNGFQEMGIETLLIDHSDLSATLTSFIIPEGFDFDGIHQGLKQKGFIIYPGQNFLKHKIFRIAVMGDLTTTDMNRFLDDFRRILKAEAAVKMKADSLKHKSVLMSF